MRHNFPYITARLVTVYHIKTMCAFQNCTVAGVFQPKMASNAASAACVRNAVHLVLKKARWLGVGKLFVHLGLPVFFPPITVAPSTFDRFEVGSFVCRASMQVASSAATFACFNGGTSALLVAYPPDFQRAWKKVNGRRKGS